ncbi:MAG: hypothetical protein AB2766_05595 [Candidatus Thiodiazotropha endolucinida]
MTRVRDQIRDSGGGFDWQPGDLSSAGWKRLINALNYMTEIANQPILDDSMHTDLG